MAHRRAMLTPFGRLLLVQRVCEMNWSAPRAAESAGVSRMTVYKWVRRYQAEGLAGLEDRSSRPKHSPRLTSADQVTAVLELRHRRRWGPHRIGPAVGLARSTVYAVLRRQGEARLSDGDRSTGLRIRYVRERPGELLHIDVKKLGRIPTGGGHALLAEEVGSLCTSPSTTARGLPLPKSEPLKTAPMGLSSSWPRQLTSEALEFTSSG